MMCTGLEPALISFVGSTVKSAIDHSQARAAARQVNAQAEAMARHQRAIAEREAVLFDQRAARARQEAAAQAAMIRRVRGREQANLRARLAASGINAGTGSALLALETRTGDSELEALSAINAGEPRAREIEISAADARYRGAVASEQSLQRGRAAREQANSAFRRQLLNNTALLVQRAI